MGISFEMFDRVSADAIAHALDELSKQYEGACSCPKWLMDIYVRAAEIERETNH